MQDADALVLGSPARLSTSSQGTVALLRRLLGAFTGTSVARGWYNTGGTFAEGLFGASASPANRPALQITFVPPLSLGGR